MPFVPTLPDFNLLADFIRSTTTLDVPCQMYLNPRAPIEQTPGNPFSDVPSIYLRVPIAFYTDRPPPWASGIWKVHHPTTGDWHYIVRFWEILHSGFPNEYLFFNVSQCSPSGNPIDGAR